MLLFQLPVGTTVVVRDRSRALGHTFVVVSVTCRNYCCSSWPDGIEHCFTRHVTHLTK